MGRKLHEWWLCKGPLQITGNLILFLISNFRRVLNVLYVLFLGISPASDCSLPTFRNPLSVPSSKAGCGVYSTSRLWRWNWQRVPKRWQTTIWRQGDTQKKEHIQLYIVLFVLILLTALYEGCLERIRTFWISRELVVWPWCNLALSQRRPYCAFLNSHSPVGLVSRQWDASNWACVLCDHHIHKSSHFQWWLQLWEKPEVAGSQIWAGGGLTDLCDALPKKPPQEL